VCKINLSPVDLEPDLKSVGAHPGRAGDGSSQDHQFARLIAISAHLNGSFAAAPEAIPTLSQVMDAAGLPHRLIMYPPFTPTAQEAAVAPGHLLFPSEGLPIWGRDAISFFDAYLRRRQ
jgi:hypothetical protein